MESQSHLATLFFDQTIASRMAPLAWRLRHGQMLPFTRGEGAEWVANYARGLEAAQIARGSRVAMLGAPSDLRLLVLLAHALRGITTIVVAHDLPLEARLKLLRESHCSVLLVEHGQQALEYLQHSAELPEVHYLISLSGTLTIDSRHVSNLGLDELMRRGRALPDRTGQWLQQVRREDAALIVGYQVGESAGGFERSVNELKTHAELLQSCERLRQLLAEAGIELAPGAPVLTHTTVTSPASFIATELLPLALGCSVDYLGKDIPEADHYTLLQPTLLVADSAYLHQLHGRLERHLSHTADRFDRFAFKNLLRLGKRRYETAEQLRFWEELIFRAAKSWIIRRIKQNLGSALRGILCVDEGLRYSTILFFEIFGIRVGEIPSVFEQQLERTRL